MTNPRMLTVDLLGATGFWNEPNADPTLKEDIRQVLKYVMKLNQLQCKYVVL